MHILLEENLLYFYHIVPPWIERVLHVLMLQYQVLSPETPKKIYFLTLVASSAKNESIK